MNARGTAVKVKVLLDMEFCEFLCKNYNPNPPTPRKM